MEVNIKPANSFNPFLMSIILLSLSACSGRALVTPPTATLVPALPTSTPPAPTSTSTSIPFAVTPSPLPTKPIFPMITPDSIHVESWKEYENALAKSVLPVSSPEEVLCEWDILGRAAQDLFVWAVCRDQTGGGSVPAVIHLEPDGTILSIETTKSNWSKENLDRLFPGNVQAQFVLYVSGRAREMAVHIEWRRTHPEEAPLIVLSAAPTPEPTSTEWLPFNPNIINNDECEKLVPTSMPVAGTENLTEEEISQKLFALYLEKHFALPTHHICKLENYRIERTTIDHRIDFLAHEQGVDFVNWIIYSIQIREVPSSWVAGNGELANEGWIINKVLIVGVTKVGDEYILKLIGTGP